MRTIAIGYTTRPVENWAQLVEPPEAPSNYKDPIKIQEYLVKAREKQAEDAADKPLTGRLAEVVALRFVDDAAEVVNLGWPDAPALELLGGNDRILCVNLRLFLKLGVLDCIAKRSKLLPDMSWAVVIDQQPVFRTGPKLIDPVRVLFADAPSNPLTKGLGITPADKLPLDGCCAALGLGAKEGINLTAGVAPTAAQLALVALRMGLLLE